jgi:hypothetical protein
MSELLKAVYEAFGAIKPYPERLEVGERTWYQMGRDANPDEFHLSREVATPPKFSGVAVVVRPQLVGWRVIGIDPNANQLFSLDGVYKEKPRQYIKSADFDETVTLQIEAKRKSRER